jgi:hypothetical protein
MPPDRKKYNNETIVEYYMHKLITLGITVIALLSIFTINMYKITAQESTDSEPTDEESELDDQGPAISGAAPERSEEEQVSRDVIEKSTTGAQDVPPPPASAPADVGTSTTGAQDVPPPPAPAPDVGTSTPSSPDVGTSTTGAQDVPPPAPAPDVGTSTPLGTSTPSSPMDEDVGRILRSTTDGFQIEVPMRWVLEDEDNTNITAQISEIQTGYTFLAEICPQYNALLVMDGGGVGRYQCQEGSTDNIVIMRFSDLYERPKFASTGINNITASDFLSFELQYMQSNAGVSNIQIWNDTDTSVDIISTYTNQIVATVPAKLVEFTYTAPEGVQDRQFALLMVNGTTGYHIFYEGFASLLPTGEPPFQVQQIFDSFGLLTGTATG